MSQQAITSQSDERDQFIQIWRGIAVILVVYYHFSNRIPPEYLGMTGPPSLVFHSGKIGVLIFFIISGYLITKSLNRCENLAIFYAKRISRIWPLFILASIVIFTFLQFVDPPIVPHGPKKFYTAERNVSDLVGSLFFLKDLGFHWIDGVFWSLLVELKFYFWIGLLATFRSESFDRDFAIMAIALGLAELAISIFQLSSFSGLATALNGVFVAQYLPFFAVGALVATRRNNGLLNILLVMVVIQMALKSAANPDFDATETATFGFVLIAVLCADSLLFKSRIFLHIGHNSYAYYLFHQIIGLSILKALSGITSYDVAICIALLGTYAIAVIASGMAEWRFRKFFSRWLLYVFSWLRLDQMPLTQATQKQAAV